MFYSNEEVKEQILLDLGQPTLRVELNNEQLDYCLMKQLRKYSVYKPNRKEKNLIVQSGTREIYLKDPDGEKIVGLGIVILPEVFPEQDVFKKQLFNVVMFPRKISTIELDNSKLIINRLNLMKLTVSYLRIFYEMEFKPNEEKIIINPPVARSGNQHIIYYTEYSNIQDVDQMGQEWVYKYQRQCQKEILGRVRSKYDGIQTPMGSITTDGKDLMSEQQSEIEKLEEQLSKRKDYLVELQKYRLVYN